MEWFILSSPADCAASMAARRTPALFPDGFAAAAKWFRPDGFWSLFVVVYGCFDPWTASGYHFRSRSPLDISPDQARGHHEKQRSEDRRHRGREQRVADGLGPKSVFRASLRAPTTSGPTPWPKQVADSRTMADASARMLGRATVC